MWKEAETKQSNNPRLKLECFSIKTLKCSNVLMAEAQQDRNEVEGM